MTLTLYRLLLLIALPLIAYQAFKRCRKARREEKANPDLPKIRHCFKSRFGFNPSTFRTGGIWIHAVSVGETRSIFPLLNALHSQYPDMPITVTSGSTQGAIQALRFSPVEIQHQMIPYDYSFAVNRFLKQIAPKLVIVVETEIWPNLYRSCHQQNIPLVLANARLKEKSFDAYRKYGGSLVTNALNQTALIAAQFPEDTRHFLKLGVTEEKVKTLGNLKFDIEVDPDLAAKARAWREQNDLNERFIWVAASTHENEETLMLDAHHKLRAQDPTALLILVPRHTDRFAEVAQLLANTPSAIRSKDQSISPDTQVYLADTVGELMLWFEACDVAFIGGSLVPFGGHNILEPAALKKPVLSGQYHMNLQALYDSFKTEDAVMISDDSQQLANQLIELAQSSEKRQTAADKAYHCFRKQTGALDRLLTEIAPYLSR
ncbi:MAG: lipid IV(A) 3-deoxy-D-manno-octulosonic acid transferase [Hydrogenovibrio sp.]|nr:lipid IV(A) 3-deoxy-D-manno-octulosonic acid transferase [Hydrogenovibrio sp.]